MVSKPQIRFKSKAQADEKSQSARVRWRMSILKRFAILQSTLADYWALGGVLKPLLESFTVAIPSIGVSYTLQGAREELGKSLKNSSDSLLKMLVDMTKLHEKNFEAIRQTMEGQLRNLREDNSKKTGANACYC